MPNVFGVDELGNRVQAPYSVTVPTPPAVVAKYGITLYGATPPAVDVTKLTGFVALQSNIKGQVAQLRAAGCPGELGVYFDTPWANAGQGLTGIPISAMDPSWFALDASNNHIPWKGSTTVLCRIDNPGFQQAWIKQCLIDCESQTYDYWFGDDWTAWYAWNTGGILCPRWPTMAAWQADFLAFLDVVIPPLRAAGLKICGNVGGATAGGAGKPDPFWVACAQRADITEEESWADGGKGLLQQLPALPVKLANAAWSEAHGKGVLCHGYSNLRANNVFGLAQMLLVAEGGCTYITSNSGTSGQQNWFPEYDIALQLGAPLGPFTLAGVVYTRQFANGTVTLNTNTLTAQIVLG